MQRMVKSLIVAFAVVVFLIAVLPYGKDLLFGFDRKLHSRFVELRPGVSATDVLKVLGDPIRIENECCLPQRHGFDAEFRRAEESDAVQYMLWRNGINWYYCIGFDKSESLVVKLEGHS